MSVRSQIIVSLSFSGIFVAFTFFFTACGTTRLAVYPTELSLFAEGYPLTGTRVTLHPVTGDRQLEMLRPTGTVDDNGDVRLSSYESGDGVPAGKYVMTLDLSQTKQIGRFEVTDSIRERFQTVQRSKLYVEVLPRQKNHSTFFLELAE